MSGRTRGAAPVVQRKYALVPDACEKAIEMLLKPHAKAGDGSTLTAPNDAMKGSSDDRATRKYTN